MTIKESMENGIAVLILKGDILSEDDTTKLKDKVHSLVTDKVNNIVMDLGGINLINSSGLGTLIASLTTMRNAGGDLRLARISEKVENLFVITKLVQVFDTYETTDRAVASFDMKK